MGEPVTIPSEFYEQILTDGGLGSFEMSDRDMACAILPDLDYEAQLIAISDLLRHNYKADAESEKQIKEVEEYARKTSGARNQRAVDEWVDLLHGSIYQSAAHSMAALGMLAPFYESMFAQAFQGIRKQYFGLSVVPPGHLRAGMTDLKYFWNCHFFYNVATKETERNLVQGIKQLAEAVDLTRDLPSDLHNTLRALFNYRNQMFHCGFEWPKKECVKFAKLIQDERWQAWFALAKRGEEPWIVYITEDFINHCIDVAHQSLDAFGAYSKRQDPIDVIPIEVSPAKK
jgi:hypothetical protein